jgi:hypothetical protein
MQNYSYLGKHFEQAKRRYTNGTNPSILLQSECKTKSISRIYKIGNIKF